MWGNKPHPKGMLGKTAWNKGLHPEGHKHSEESLGKLREAWNRRSRVFSDVTKKRISEGIKNRVKSDYAKCAKCDELFLKNASNQKYCSYKCFNAVRVIKKKLKSNYKEKVRQYNLKKSFGITPAEYDKKLAEQENKCAICGMVYEGSMRKRFAVDHDHTTGLIRGLLCSGCNTGIGGLGDSVELLEKAIKYLKLWK